MFPEMDDDGDFLEGWSLIDYLSWSDNKVLSVPATSILFVHESVDPVMTQIYWKERKDQETQVIKPKRESTENVVSFFKSPRPS